MTAVHEVAEEDVILVRGGSADLVGQEVEEVEELAVDVADDCDGGSDRLDVGFFHEEFRDGGAQALDGIFADGFPRFEGFDVFVYVVAHCLELCLFGGQCVLAVCGGVICDNCYFSAVASEGLSISGMKGLYYGLVSV